MSIINGTIKTIVADGGYNTKYGYNYRFKMTIDTPNGEITGEIAAKSQVYPMTAGQPITVDLTTDQYGTKFKKVDPQYAQNTQQGQQQAAQGQNAGTAQSNTTKIDYEKKERERQALITRTGAAKCAAWLMAGKVVIYNDENIKSEIRKWYEIITFGHIIPAPNPAITNQQGDDFTQKYGLDQDQEPPISMSQNEKRYDQYGTEVQGL